MKRVSVALSTRRAKHLRAFSQVIFSVMSSPFRENIYLSENPKT